MLVIALFSGEDGHIDSLTLNNFRLAYRCIPTLCLEEKNNQWLNFSHIEFEFASRIFFYNGMNNVEQWDSSLFQMGSSCALVLVHLRFQGQPFSHRICKHSKENTLHFIEKKCIPKSLVMYAWVSFLVWVLLLFRAVINQQQLMAHYHDYSWLPIWVHLEWRAQLWGGFF